MLATDTGCSGFCVLHACHHGALPGLSRGRPPRPLPPEADGHGPHREAEDSTLPGVLRHCLGRGGIQPLRAQWHFPGVGLCWARGRPQPPGLAPSCGSQRPRSCPPRGWQCPSALRPGLPSGVWGAGSAQAGRRPREKLSEHTLGSRRKAVAAMVSSPGRAVSWGLPWYVDSRPLGFAGEVLS